MARRARSAISDCLVTHVVNIHVLGYFTVEMSVSMFSLDRYIYILFSLPIKIFLYLTVVNAKTGVFGLKILVYMLIKILLSKY